jgi:hypothetical protein
MSPSYCLELTAERLGSRLPYLFSIRIPHPTLSASPAIRTQCIQQVRSSQDQLERREGSFAILQQLQIEKGDGRGQPV